MFKTRFTAIENASKEKGTIIKGETRTRQDQAEDTEIYTVLEKYTNSGIVPKLKNAEPMYIDTTQIPQTLNERLELRGNLQEYYKNMTALSRKKWNDNFEEFVDDFMNGNFEKFIETGALTSGQAEEQIQTYQSKDNELKNLLMKQAEEKYTKIINNLKEGKDVQI